MGYNMAKQSIFSNTIKYFTLVLILMAMLFPLIKADICNDSFEYYKDYMRNALINSFDEIKNDLKWLNDEVVTYEDKQIIESVSYNKPDLEINITSGIDFSEIDLLDFKNNPIGFTLSHLNKMEVNNEPFNISDESFDAYYGLFKNTTFFDIVKGLNVTHINFNGTEYKIDSNKENIKNIIKSSNVIDYLGEDPENFTLEFTIKIDDGNGGCKKDVNLDFKFFEKSIQVDAMIGFHNILVNAEFEKDSVRVSFEYEDIIFLVNTKLDEHDVIIKGEFAEKITDYTEGKPVMVDSPNSIINIEINESVTTPGINVSKLISSGKGEIPKIIINASSANNIIINIPSTNITSSNVSWDGIIRAPTIVNVSIPEARGKIRTQSIAIKIGSDSGTLTFEKAVKLVFPSEAGKNVAFFADGEFNEINTICSSNSQSWADSNLGTGKDCYINDGLDLVVWTKHFTEFVTYTEASSRSLIGEGVCVTEWECSEWSSCTNGIQTRICSYPSNFCEPNAKKPVEIQTCVSDIKDNLLLNDDIKAPDSNIKAGLGLGAVIGNIGGSIYWIILALIIIIITLIIILAKSNKQNLNTKTNETIDISSKEPSILEPEKEDLDSTKDVKLQKSTTKKSKKPKSSITKK